MAQYSVYITPGAWNEIKDLPGNMRQRVRRAIDGFEDNPRPSGSHILDVAGLPIELRRLRLDRWRIVYAIAEAESSVDVLAVRKRPPYDYSDLEELLQDIL